MQINSADLFLFKFYSKLKNNLGIELDIKQYEDFLHIFSNLKLAKEEIQFQKQIYIICKSLWLTKDIYEIGFKQLFDEEIKKWTYVEKSTSITETSNGKNKKNEIIDIPKISDGGIKPKAEIVDTSKSEQDNKEIKEGAVETNIVPLPNEPKANKMEYFVSFEAGQSTESSSPISVDNEKIPFLFSKENHLPIDSRKVTQIFKKLKLNLKKVESDRIDPKNTIKNFLNNEAEFKIINQLINSGNQDFHVFVEQDGPMIAFNEWAKKITNILQNFDINNNINIYHFTNYPLPVEGKTNEYLLFKKQKSMGSILLSKILKKLNKNSIVFFFSDAGALDNKLNENRIKHSVNFLKLIQLATKKIIWINPVIEEYRWNNTSAYYIGFFCKMVPFTNKGLDSIISTVRIL